MNRNQAGTSGLNNENRKFIVILVIGILLIFGPIEPYGLVVRSVYLIIIPTLTWLVLKHWGSNWKMDRQSNDRLNRALLGGIAGALLVGAYLSYTSAYHTECDQYAGRGDNRECVGDYITVKGPDMTKALIQLAFAGIAVWYAVSKRPERD